MHVWQPPPQTLFPDPRLRIAPKVTSRNHGGMTKRFAAAMAALLFLLPACSSSGGNSEPSDAAFCESFENWLLQADSLGTTVDPLQSAVSEATDPDALPTADELHAMGEALLSGTTELEGIFEGVLANTRDPRAAEALKGANEVVVSLFRWTGEAARDSDSFLDFSAVILEGNDFVAEQQAAHDALDGEAMDQYVLATCPDLYSQYFGAPAR